VVGADAGISSGTEIVALETKKPARGSRREPATGGRTHRRQEDRVLDCEQSGQCGFDDGQAGGDRWFADSPLEQRGFELPVPP
jgi:hypothetical protein